jgi:hypothetical protein
MPWIQSASKGWSTAVPRGTSEELADELMAAVGRLMRRG